MPSPSSDRRVLVSTRDLFFRAKLSALVERAGRRVTRSGPAELAIVELGAPEAVERVRALRAAGTPVVAFGSHVRPDLLRAARAAGAVAVPNSEVERAVREALDTP